jgi:bifunctional DNA-binding transcriptional regulator/antitoxin component of YhaV-PrlF toxin-antitoxin module
MTLARKRQTVFPLDWRRREGLERGGPLNVFDLGEDGLLIRPIKPPGKRIIAKLLRQVAAGQHSAAQSAARVQQASRRERDVTRRNYHRHLLDYGLLERPFYRLGLQRVLEFFRRNASHFERTPRGAKGDLPVHGDNAAALTLRRDFLQDGMAAALAIDEESKSLQSFHRLHA